MSATDIAYSLGMVASGVAIAIGARWIWDRMHPRADSYSEDDAEEAEYWAGAKAWGERFEAAARHVPNDPDGGAE